MIVVIFQVFIMTAEPVRVRSVFSSGLFAGKVALVSGGGTGIGLRTARELARLGCRVFIAARRFNLLETAAQSINNSLPPPPAGHGAWAVPVELNIRDTTSIENCIQTVLSQSGGKIDYLVSYPRRTPHVIIQLFIFYILFIKGQ